MGSSLATAQSFVLAGERAGRLREKPACIWLTGLSGAGKSTIAFALERMLWSGGVHGYVLDADIMRQGLNRDLGFSREDRFENVRRLACVARIMVDAGLVPIVASISPYALSRTLARALFAQDDFIEVYVSTDIQTCIKRDPKELYARALRGEIHHLSGLDDPYEAPSAPELLVDTATSSAEDGARLILAFYAASCRPGAACGSIGSTLTRSSTDALSM
jgi:adenylyl-sulfate kinase